MEHEESPAVEAGETVVDAQTEQPEAVETEGQVETPPAEGEEPEDKADGLSKNQRRNQRRREYIEQLQRERDDAVAEAERLKAAQDLPPQENMYSDYEDYRVAKILHDQRQQMRASEEQQASQRIQSLDQQRQREVQAGWQEQIVEARTRHTDFDAVALNNNLPVSQAMAEVISQSDVGADVLYHLGSNPTKAYELAQMHNPVQVAREVGRLEALVARPKPKTETHAPQPIQPVRGKAPASKDPTKMSMTEYAEWRRKQG